MGKDPAFLFYTKDFYNGVADLTMEERGQYITLLCLQHTKGHLTRKMIEINIPDISDDVISKFKQDKMGRYYNERLESEIDRREEQADKQRQRAKSGWKKRKAALAKKTTKPKQAGQPEQKPYSKHDFFNDWNGIRQKIMKTKSALNSIGGYEDMDHFRRISESYSQSDIRNALAGLFKQRSFPGPPASYTTDPKHFFKFFERYLQAWNDQNFDIWKDDKSNPR